MNYNAKIKWLGRKTVYGKWSSNRYNVNKLYYVHDGSCRVITEGEERYLEKGRLYLIPAASDISPESNPEHPLDHSYVDFELIPPISIDGLYTLDPSTDNLTRAASDILLALTEERNFGAYFGDISRERADILSSALLFLVKQFISSNGIPETNYDEVAMSMLADISESIECGISVDTLAKKYFMTPESVIRKFKRAFNVTPMTYLRRLRLNTASYLLGTGKKLSDVAHEVGYADPSSLLHAISREQKRARLKN